MRRSAQLTAGVLFAAGTALRLGLLIAARPAFLGIPDSGTYLDAAHSGLFSDPVDPIGYAAFLRLVHDIGPPLLGAIVVQHLFGLATAALLLGVGRAAGSRWAGVLAAAAVLLNGLQLWVEQSPMSDSLFTFLCVLALYLTVRAQAGERRWLIVLGVVLGVTPVVRSAGLLLIPTAVLWLAWTSPGPVLARIIHAAAPAGVAVVLVLAYATLEQHRTGVFGFTQSDGRIEYAVAAPFARCGSFAVPAGTRALCQTTPPSRRESFNAYLWGFPDGASALPAGGRGVTSPAWRLYGPMPGGNGPLGAFGRAAIVGEPVPFLAQAWRNFTEYWRAPPTPYIDAAITPQAGIVQAAAAYDGGSVSAPARSGLGFFRWWARHVEVDGWLLAAVIFVSPFAVLARDRQARAIGVLCAVAGWLLLAGSAVVASDSRYALPAIGPLTLAAVIAIGGVASRLRRVSAPAS